MLFRMLRAVALGALFSALPSTSVLAQAKTVAAGDLPAGWQARNVTPISHIALSGKRIFKLGLKEKNGRFYLFVADGADGRPEGSVQVVDVTDPAKPRVAAKIPLAVASGQLTLHGDLLIAGQQQPYSPPYKGGSVEYPYRGLPAVPNDLATLYDISDPTRPKRLSAWRTTGWATHRNSYPGGKYAFMSSWVHGYRGQSVLVILDVSDPRKPKEVSRWAQPDQAGEAGAGPRPAPGFHGPVTLSPDGRMATFGFTPSFVNLDISEPANPKVIGKLDFSPLAPIGTAAIHTVVPMTKGYWYLSTEPGEPGCDAENTAFAAVVDNRDPMNPKLASYFPRPVPPKDSGYSSFCEKEGRVGPHNVNTEFHQDAVQQPGKLIYQTYFNAGLRIIDVSDPREPQELGWFLPKIGPWKEGKRGPEDVIVDRRGNIFTTTGREAGIWVLRFSPG